MTKQDLKSLIKEVLSEALYPPQIDPKSIVGGEIAAWKKTCDLLSKKLSANLVGKPMSGELVKGDPYSRNDKRKPITTTIKSLNIELSYKTGSDNIERSNCYLQVYAYGEQGQAGQVLFSDYI